MPSHSTPKGKLNVLVGGRAIPWYLSGGIAAASCVAAYLPKGAATQAASYTNLANPGTYNASAPGTAPAWDATNGWKFTAASSHYLTTGVVAAQGYSIVVRFSDVGNDGCLVGSFVTNFQCLIIRPDFVASTIHYVRCANGVAAVNVTPKLLSGVYAICAQVTYRNGVQDYATLDNPGAPNTQACYIGALNNAGSPAIYCTAYVQALAIYNTSVAAQISALSTAMAAL